MTFLAGDPIIGRSLEEYGEWAQNEITLLATLLAEGAVTVDAGANVGTHSLAFAHLVGATGRVFAFEPQPDLYRLLCRNVGDNSADCVDPRCEGLSDQHEMLYLPGQARTEGINPGAIQLLQAPPEDGEVIPVDAFPLDDLHLNRCDLIKADVEGMELHILRGAESTLDRCRPVLYLECNTISHAAGIFDYLREKPYQIYLHKAPAFNPTNFFGSVNKIFGTACESSILAIPHHMNTEDARLTANIQVMPIRSLEDLAVVMAETQMIVDLRQALAHAEKLAIERQAELVRYEKALGEARRIVAQQNEEIARLRQALE